MKNFYCKSFVWVLVMLLSFTASAQFRVFLKDTFSVEQQRIDLSELIVRFGETEAASAFEYGLFEDGSGNAFQSVRMNAIGEQVGVCCSYNNGSYLAHNCLDFVFPKTILRSSGDTLRIEFDAIWDIANDAKGEASKIIAYLMYDYPQDGPGFMVYNDMSKHHYGKPAYQLWILNGSNRAFITYGAGLAPKSGFITLPAGSPEYWLPGFTEKRVETGEIDQQDPYPVSAYARLMEGSTVSSQQWMHYTWEVTKDRLSLYWRPVDQEEKDNQLLLFMQTPPDGSLAQINAAHGSSITELPPFYEYLDEMNAFRMFINKKSRFANLIISKTGTPLGTYAEFQPRSAAQRRPRADAGSYTLPLLLFNGVENGETQVEVSLVKGNAAHVNNFSHQLVEFKNTTSDMQTGSLELTLTDIFMSENDTLLFEITNVFGGNYPSSGPQRFFELIIRSSGATSVDITESEKYSIYPNPATSKMILTGFEPGAKLFILDTSGKVVYENAAYQGQEIDVQSWVKGVYFLKILERHYAATLKFVKQ
jgi:hypothetical protein